MKTRLNRLWMSLALAAGSTTFPLASLLAAHDLPTRYATDGGSQSAWNYLLDDCVDIGDYSDEAPADWDCGHTYAAPASPSSRSEMVIDSNAIEGDAARNSLASFSHELTCWMDQWSRLSERAAAAARDDLAAHAALASGLVAAIPDEGCPPGPNQRPEDTCGFQREFLSVQAAADILQAEVERAAVQNSNISELAIAETAAEVTKDAHPAVEIPQQYARGIDEYLAYDHAIGESHWIGGLNKSWKLRAALRQTLSPTAATESSEAAEATTDPLPQAVDSGSIVRAADWMRDTECFAASIAFDLWPMSGAGHAFGEWISQSIHFSSQHLLAFGHYLDHRSSVEPIIDKPSSDKPISTAAAPSELIIVYTDATGDSLAVPQAFAQAWNGSEQQLSGEELAVDRSVPASLEAPSASDRVNDESVATDPVIASTANMLAPAAWRQWLLSKAASQLDSVGAFCLQSARQLSNWAQPQVATRAAADVR